jgi:pSer/pThr/pTyr-binding forkhead associated (FHA) protein
MGTLTRVRDGFAQGLSADVQVGRSTHCALCIAEPYVSAMHAAIRWTNDAWEVKDLGSHNGTQVRGRRLGIGDRIQLDCGAELSFGHARELWIMTESSPPQVAAVDVESGVVHEVRDGVIVLPGAENESACMFCAEGNWCLETSWGLQRVADGEIFAAAGRRFRLHCSPSLQPTETSRQVVRELEDATLVFRVSADEEEVELLLDNHGYSVSLGKRTCYYAALTLGRQLIRDRRLGLADPGWVQVSDLLRMLPDYGCVEHLNVDIHRLRRSLSQAGVVDYGRVIERRSGLIRLHPGDVRIELPGSTERSAAK